MASSASFSQLCCETLLRSLRGECFCCFLSQATNLGSSISGCKIRASWEKAGLGKLVCQMPLGWLGTLAPEGCVSPFRIKALGSVGSKECLHIFILSDFLLWDRGTGETHAPTHLSLEKFAFLVENCLVSQKEKW